MYIVEVTKDTSVIWTAVCSTQVALLKAVDDAKNKIPNMVWNHIQPNYNEIAIYQSDVGSNHITIREPDVVYSI